MKTHTMFCRASALAFAVLLVSNLAQAQRTQPSLGASSATPMQTREVVVKLEPGVDAPLLAGFYGLRYVRPLADSSQWHLFSATSVAQASAARDRLASNPRVLLASQLSNAIHIRHGFTPNDPYYPFNSPAGFPGQWHLHNTETANLDARVVGAWNAGFTGQGVVIGIVDDSFETGHPDLAPNYYASASYDFGAGDSDPNPLYSDDMHGISVAGVAGARGGNGIGVTGAAPYAKLAGIRLDFAGFGPSSQWVEGPLYKSSGPVANRLIQIKNFSYGALNPYQPVPAEKQAHSDSVAAGTIHVMSAGNDRDGNTHDANSLDSQSNPDVITVAALGSDGRFADYSNFGANVFVTAPSDSEGLYGITTTDRTGTAGYNNGASGQLPNTDYTSDFGGTSSSSPLVAGVLALVKEANPNLNARMAKHLIARTADVVDAGDATAESDGGWRTNGAGLWFNQNYGFGNVDAASMTVTARQFLSTTPRVSTVIGTTTVNAAIPDNDPTGVTKTFYVGSSLPVEEVTVHLVVNHSQQGSLTATLESPSGFKQRLMSTTTKGGGMNWTFCANGFWGENSKGTWKLKLADVVATAAGTWVSFDATVRHGYFTSRLGSNVGFFRSSDRRMGMWPLINGAIATWQSLPTTGTAWRPVGFGDLDGDGKQDILLRSTANKLGFWKMDRYEIAGWVNIGSVSPSWNVLDLIDLDKDGDQDIILYDPTARKLGAWIMNGPTISGWKSIGSLAAETVPRGFGDFNWDGKPDVLLDITGIRKMGVWTLDAGTITGWLNIGYYGAGWTVSDVGDINYDNSPDVLVRQTASNALGVYKLMGTTINGWQSLGKAPTGWDLLGLIPM